MTLMALVVAVTAGAQTSLWNPDYDEDGIIGAADLLALLTVFGVDDDGDGIWGGADLCTDTDACNFQANPSEECQYLDAIGECGGYCSEDIDGNGICDWICGADLISYEGYDYQTVQIGADCWYAENSRYLPEVTPANVEASNYTPNAMVLYYNGEDIIEASQTATYELYGALYNGPAFNDWQTCPNGWHASNGSDWNLLIESAGGVEQAGLVLKDSITWNGNDSLGFKMLNGPSDAFNGRKRDYRIIRKSNSGIFSSIVRFTSLDEIVLEVRYANEMYPIRCVKD